MKSKKEIPNLAARLSEQREQEKFHLAYERENEFYEAVQNGNIRKVKKLFLPLTEKSLGRLSKNKITNCKYHLVVAIAMMTRFCIEGGLAPEEAYTLSDLYIQRMDSRADQESLDALHKSAVLGFASRMKGKNSFKGMSKNIIRAKEFILDNARKKILLDQMAAALGMNKTYLCELFKKETGMTVKNFILETKIKEAKEIIKSKNFSNAQAAAMLCFSSESHFIKTFKRFAKMTPGEYRKKNFRKFYRQR